MTRRVHRALFDLCRRQGPSGALYTCRGERIRRARDFSKYVATGPMDTPFFYPAETPDSIAYHKSQSMNGKRRDIKDMVPIVKFLATEGWWITGQTIFANGGYTTR